MTGGGWVSRARVPDECPIDAVCGSLKGSGVVKSNLAQTPLNRLSGHFRAITQGGASLSIPPASNQLRAARAALYIYLYLYYHRS